MREKTGEERRERDNLRENIKINKNKNRKMCTEQREVER